MTSMLAFICRIEIIIRSRNDFAALIVLFEVQMIGGVHRIVREGFT